jgi:bifunctional non-homologous end joining protein LigD
VRLGGHKSPGLHADTAALPMSPPTRAGPRPSGFIKPALPYGRDQPPTGSGWIHEIKFDGFRMLARRDGARVRLYTRNGHDWTERFPLIRVGMAATQGALRLIDGEAVCCEVDGVPSFELLRYRHHDGAVFLCALPNRALASRRLRHIPAE